jgi:hypothetical protein
MLAAALHGLDVRVIMESAARVTGRWRDGVDKPLVPYKQVKEK